MSKTTKKKAVYTLKERKKCVDVIFATKYTNPLRDAPAKSFSKEDYLGSMKLAKSAANGYATSLEALSQHSRNLSRAIKTIPSLKKDKINFRINFEPNRTGVVGVYLEHTYVRHGQKIPYAYTANYVVDGIRVKKRFAFSEYESSEAAFKAAVAFRLFAINAQSDLLYQ